MKIYRNCVVVAVPPVTPKGTIRGLTATTPKFLRTRTNFRFKNPLPVVGGPRRPTTHGVCSGTVAVPEDNRNGTKTCVEYGERTMSASDRERGSKRVHDLRSCEAKKPKASQSPWPRAQMVRGRSPAMAALDDLSEIDRLELQFKEAERKMIERKITMVIKEGGDK